jgi:hypothetical protein
MVNEHHTEQKLIEANPVPQPEHLHEDPSEAQALLALIMERRDAMTMTKQPATFRTPRGPRWQPVAVAAASGVLILIVIGVAAFIGFRSDESETANQPTTLPTAESTIPTTPEVEPPVTTLPPVVTTLPPAPATLQDGTWEHETSATGFGPPQVFETSLGLLGTVSNDGIFLSQDGIEWSQVLALPQGEIIESRVLSVVEYKGAVYAFAAVGEQRIAYRTTDGFDWEGAPYATYDGYHANFMFALAGEDELLAIQSKDYMGSYENEPVGPPTQIMRSEDGQTWTRHETWLLFEGWDYAIFVDGRYLAVVVEPESVDYPHGKRSMAESSDGIEWEVITGSDFPFNRFPRDLTEYDGRLYMGGWGYEDGTMQQGTIFYSDDGASWQQAVLPDIADLRFVTKLVPTEYGLLAVGEAKYSEDDLANPRLVIMTTVDGSTFIEVPHPAGLFDGAGNAGATFTAGDRIIIRGWGNEPHTRHQWIWTADR